MEDDDITEKESVEKKKSPDIEEDDESSDDDLSFDFSKIKNFFKGSKAKKNSKEIKKEAKELENEIEERVSEEKKKIGELKKEEKELKKHPEKSGEIKENIEEDKEDEINIDFSKIKGFFKKAFKDDEEKKVTGPHKEKKKEAKESEDDDISLDFSKIKNFFKQKKKENDGKGKDDESDEDIGVDFRSITLFLKKYVVVFAVLLPLILSMYIRMQGSYLPMTDDWAKGSVYNYFKGQINAQISQQYPNLPDSNKNQLIEEEFAKFMIQQKSMVEQQVAGTSNYFKSFMQDDTGRVYMPDIDPYYWERYSKNILEKGAPGDIVKDGKQWDNHQLAPNGRPAEESFHVYFLAYLYKFMHFFNSALTLRDTTVLMPVLISALSVIPAFFIGKMLVGNIGGFFAAAMLAANTAFLSRTMWGHADTDVWNVFFPLVIVWMFLEAFKAENRKKGIIFSSVAGFFSGLYSFTWIGWWYILDFIIVTTITYIGYLLVINIKKLKNISAFLKQKWVIDILLIFFIYLVSSSLFIVAFSGFKNLKVSLIGPMSFGVIKAPVLKTLWPNVLTTVAEMNEGNIQQIINSIGGKFLFYFSIFFGILAALVIGIRNSLKRESHENVELKVAILLSLWYIGSIYASFKGIRFTLILAPAFSIAFGVGIGFIFIYLSKWLSKGLRVNDIIIKTVLFAAFLLLLVNPIKASYYTARSDVPIINDAWYNTLNKIKIESKENAIISSWWDFGHHFKAIADRTVTFDGTTQDTPQAHWIGKILLTNDEKQAIGILRMLDCGGNNAFNALFKINNDSHKSIDILYDIIMLKKEDAAKELAKEGLAKNKIDEILSYTHCNPPEAFFIASEDMIGKSGVWSHFGSWDFEKAYIWYNLRGNEKDEAVNDMQKRFNYSKEKAEQLYFEVQSINDDREANSWVSPWPGYASGLSGCAKKENDAIICPLGQAKININLTTMEADIPTSQGTKHPDSLVYPVKEGIKIKKFNETIGAGMTLIPVGDNYYSVASSEPLPSSIFTRMFFMEGHGLKYFTKFSDEKTIFGGRIITWKVDWNGNATNILEAFQEKKINTTLADEKEEEETKAKEKVSEINISNTDNIAKNKSDTSNKSENATIKKEKNTQENSSNSPPNIEILS